MNAIVLLSGGIDSCVCLAIAKQQKKCCVALSFDYGQKHQQELTSAKAIAHFFQIEHHVISLDPLPFQSSSLVGNQPVSKNRSKQEMDQGPIPLTYVPARNTLFLAYAAAWAEAKQASEIYFGANASDKNGYPDCRPEFFSAFQNVLNVATKQALEGTSPQIITPLIDLTKKEVIQLGSFYQAPLELTWSCYDPTEEKLPCQHCDACLLRASHPLYNKSLPKRFPH